MEQASAARQGGDDPSLDRNGLCLLSLDGGGVRGLSTLYILQGIMRKLNHRRREAGLYANVKPCEIFDLIGGTSTGGLIAIMLGRLEMDVDECITEYRQLMETIFGQTLRSRPINMLGNIKPQFDSRRLGDAITQVITRHGASETELLNDGSPRGCKVFVCATASETKTITRLRSYSLSDEHPIPATICQSALATSAATTYFEQVRIGARRFVDGALGANNPVVQVEEEATDIWSAETGDLKPLVKCFVSIGTGNPGKKAIEDKVYPFLTKTLRDLSTETERTADSFITRWRKPFDEKRYFRFNVHQGLQDVGLAEFKEEGKIEANTAEYLEQTEQRFRTRDCVENLQLKQNKTITNFGHLVIERYHQDIIDNHNKNTIVERYDILPRFQVTYFIGRKQLLKDIQKKVTDFLGDSSSHRVLVLQALGGQGKSQLALRYCQDESTRKIFRGIFWVDASSEVSVVQAFEAIAARLYEKVGQGRPGSGTSKEVVTKALEGWKDKWLLVFDNYDDLNAFTTNITTYVPLGRSGVVLFTTRRREVANLGFLIEVPPMSEEEALSLLWSRCSQKLPPRQLKDEECPAAKEIAQLSGYLPLAIDQAGAHIFKYDLTPAQYLRAFENNKERLLQETPNPEFWQYKKSLNHETDAKVSMNTFTTWETSLQFILPDGENGQAAIEDSAIEIKDGEVKVILLTLSSFLGKTRIREHLFRIYHQNSVQSPAWLSCFTKPTRKWDSFKFQQFASELQELTLLESIRKDDSDTCYFTFHPLVREWSRLRQNDQIREAFSRVAIHMLSQFIITVGVGKMSLETKSEILVHLDQCIENSKKFLPSGKGLGCKDLQDSALCFASFYKYHSRLKASKDLYNLVLGEQNEILSNTQSERHMPNRLKILNTKARLAQVCMENADFKEAQILYEQVFKDSKLLDKTLRGEVLAGLMDAHGYQGHLRKAAELGKLALDLGTGLDVQIRVQTMIAQANLAAARGRIGEARKLTEKAVVLGEKELGPFDNVILQAKMSQAKDFALSGDLEKAKDIQLSVLRASEERNGPEHRITLNAMIFLGVTHLQHTGQDRIKHSKRAERLFKRSKDLGEQLFKDTPGWFSVDALIANSYAAQERWEEAEKLFTECWKYSLRTSHENLGLMFDVTVGLFRCYAKQGKFMEAATLCPKVLWGFPVLALLRQFPYYSVPGGVIFLTSFTFVSWRISWRIGSSIMIIGPVSLALLYTLGILSFVYWKP